ncbi:MAG: amidohydrolase [Peptococcaceae bacterium]|nr:amidohydrolase [Peptococcaceae bacterium]
MKVYYNGPIVTMEDEMPVAEMLIEKDGHIIYVGDEFGAQKYLTKDCQWIDLEGNTLMPAFIDGHGHFSATGTFLKTVPLQSAECFDDITRLMKEHLKAHASEDFKVLVGMGYDHNFLIEHDHPNRQVLDAVRDDIPVLVVHTSMHMAVANSKLLEIAGFDKDAPEIPGGVIARDPETGEPNGLLEEMAMHAVLPYVGNIFSAESVDDLVRAQELYIKNGILTIQDGASNAQSVDLCREAAREGLLKCDIVSYPCLTMGETPEETVATVHENSDCVNHYVDRFKIGGYKIVLDGSPQCKTAWLSEDYTDGTNGYPWVTDAAVQRYVDIAVDEGLQVLTHCNGDAAGDQFLRAYENAMTRYPEGDAHHDLRPVMIHCQTARDDQLDKMADLDMIASIFVAHVNYWGDVHTHNMGLGRASHISPVKGALDRGITVNFHTDTPIVMPDLFHSVWTAVNRRTRNGAILGEDQRIDVWNALKAITSGAAYSYFEEDSKGTLAPGKLADLVILDANPLSVPSDDLKDIHVLTTIKEGEILYDVRVEEEEAEKEALVS